MLPRASLILVAIGITAVAAASYNNDYRTDSYGRSDRTYNDRNYPRNDQTYDRRGPFDQNTYPQNYPQNYGQNNGGIDYNNREYNNRQFNNGKNNGPYAVNETAIFCYVNVTGNDNLRAPYNTDPLAHIEPRLCTHLIIGAATINKDRIQLVNDEVFSRQGVGSLSYDKISDLRRLNPQLKMFISISASSDVWEHAVRSSRDTLINSIVNICRDRKIGVNIDWQWPARNKLNAVENFFQFLLELKGELRSLPVVSHELSVLLPAVSQKLIDIIQPRNTVGAEPTIELMMDCVDYWILMAVELRGHWDQKIEHHAPIDSYSGSLPSVKKAIDDVRTYAPRNYLYKFVLAIPFYGKRYQLAMRAAERGSPMYKELQRQHTSYDDANILRIPYNKVCRDIATQSEFHFGYDETNGCPYAYHDTTVYVYEDTRSVKAKTRLAILSSFGGVMAYRIDMDDTTGECAQASKHMSSYDRNSYNSFTSSSEEKHPLLNAIKDQVHRGNAAQFHSSPLAIAFAVICAFILKVNN